VTRLRHAPINQQAPDPFEAFESVSEIFASVYSDLGAEALKELLAAFLENPRPSLSREALEQAANELCIVGRKVPAFKEAAKLVFAAAETARTETELGPHCPYNPDDSVHWEHWHTSQGLPVPDR